MTTDLLKRRREVTKADLAMKLEIEDWHGVADAAMDLREIDAMLSVLPKAEDTPMVQGNRDPAGYMDEQDIHEWRKPVDLLGVHLHDFHYSPGEDAYLCRCGAKRSKAEAHA